MPDMADRNPPESA